MLEKIKLYSRHASGNKKYKSFLDELERFTEISKKLEIYGAPDVAFLAILKLICQKTEQKNFFLDLKPDDEIIFKTSKKKDIKKWRVVEIDFERYIFVMESEISPNHKIWLGTNFVKTKKQSSIFRYFEGYMTEKISVGLNKVLSQNKNKKSLKTKAQILENKINTKLKNGIRTEN